ncbi:hypothetical protein NM208_g3875 [Fusarium decemcellulare]|uniref:Uncharacterized protein n=1 Tax=Fusarium decemcellulare TaxID=57161 RepID=A0ACC1SMM6_9HYPO|nr:hypothetical protein NM208_g3875 [Fusarium decemcellulare]
MTGSGLMLNWDHLEHQSNFSRNHHLALYDDKQDHPSGPQRVIIEWIFFSQFPDGELEDSSIQRLLDLAELSHTPKPARFRALDCLGFLPPKSDGMKGYGFVFPFPALPNSPPTTIQPRTLRQMLEVRFSNWSLSLGDKFNMAKALASNLCHLHRHEWLHRNIHSENVIFFVDENNQRLRDGPYLISFHHSRKDEQKFYSDVPSVDSDSEALLYQHPDYKYDENRFKKDYDRYSLGIMLLELAYWNPVLKMRQQEGDVPRDQFREKLLRKYVPEVAEIMGNTYREATELCLRGSFGSKGEATGMDETSRFSLDVVQTLESCQVG